MTHVNYDLGHEAAKALGQALDDLEYKRALLEGIDPVADINLGAACENLRAAIKRYEEVVS